MKKQTVKLPAENSGTARNYDGEKETHNVMHVIAATRDGMRQIITCRFYSARSRGSSVHYCSVWFTGKASRYGSGTGKAGGWGYHKDSAALDAALRAAGVTLGHPIAGVGPSAMRGTLRALAAALGYRKTFIVEQ